jgi:hypothetical protein
MSLAFGVDSTGIHPFLVVLLACGLDRLLGDPPGWPHPVVVMGWWITRLRRLGETWAGDRPWALRLAGLLITVGLVGGSGLAGWGLEQLACWWPALGLPLLLLGLASALAGRSLEQAVEAVLAVLPQPEAPGPARPEPGGLEPRPPNQATGSPIPWSRPASGWPGSWGATRPRSIDQPSCGRRLRVPVKTLWMACSAPSSGCCSGRPCSKSAAAPAAPWQARAPWPWPGPTRPAAPSIPCWAIGGAGCCGWARPAPGSMICSPGCPAGWWPSACPWRRASP